MQRVAQPLRIVMSQVHGFRGSGAAVPVSGLSQENNQYLDGKWMLRALRLASYGLGQTSPNPPVGCVLVKDNVAVGEGFHAQAGKAHAEVQALNAARELAYGATAYVTLEPCCHYGRTPPCVPALIKAGVRRVVIAALDPNPQVSGGGLQALHKAGIAITIGVHEQRALRQQAGFRSLLRRARPWLIYKAAMTLDGKIATPTGDSQWVSCDAARQLVHLWRSQVDAVAVGSQTVLADDPLLTPRGVSGGRSPRAVIFDRRGRVAPTAKAVREGTVVVTAETKHRAALAAKGAQCILEVEPQGALRALGELGIATLLLEGGAQLASSLLQHGLIDEVRMFIAPKILGAGAPALTGPVVQQMQQALFLHNVSRTLVGDDVLVKGDLSEIPALAAGEVQACFRA